MTDLRQTPGWKDSWKDGWQTREGDLVTILADDLRGGFPIVALIRGDERDSLKRYTLEGGYTQNGKSCYDLIPRPKRIRGWLNVYDGPRVGELQATRDKADAVATYQTRIACVYLDVEEGDGV